MLDFCRYFFGQGDTIESIEIHDDCADLFEEQAANITRWNSKLRK